MSGFSFWKSEAALAKITAYVDGLLDGSPRTRCATPAEVEGKRVDELKRMLCKRGLKQSGRKGDLIARLTTEVPNVAKVRSKIRVRVCWAVIDLIHDYGDTGFGDKPEGMCRVEYWLAHLEPSRY